MAPAAPEARPSLQERLIEAVGALRGPAANDINWTQVDAKAEADASFGRLTGEIVGRAPREAADEALAADAADAVVQAHRPARGRSDDRTPPPTQTKGKIKYLHEGAYGASASDSLFLTAVDRVLGAFGFRSVRGVVHDATVGRLPAGADAGQIIDQISGQFGVDRAEVLAIGLNYGLDEQSPRQAWLAVYDRLQAINRDHFKRLDSGKYHGWSSFRELGNRQYAEGWRGAFQRAIQLQKYAVGFAFRFPYHLFDMFLFGYFRQAIAFEFAHSREDFISLNQQLGPQAAAKMLEVAFRGQASRRVSAIDGLRAKDWYRAVDRWALTPLVRPLGKFLVRRVTMAVFSAVAMGVLGAFAPVLPLSFALTAIPWLGPGIVWALNGLPVAAAMIPGVGGILAPVAAATVGALAHDLVLGPLLNTLILSTMLTYPRAVSAGWARLRHLHPETPMHPAEMLWSAMKTGFTGSFWTANLKSILALATVGAEIEGIMTYAAQVDDVIDPHWRVVEKIGAAVERPAGDSPIPFGGAITWGNVLLMKAQDLVGLHISDMVTHGLSALGAPAATDHGIPAEAVVSALQTRRDQPSPVDGSVWKMAPGAAAARIQALADQTGGGVDAEMKAVRAHERQVRGAATGVAPQPRPAPAQHQPLDLKTRAPPPELLRELSAARASSYVESKLAQRSDLDPANIKAREASAEVSRLRALEAKYKETPPPSAGSSGGKRGGGGDPDQLAALTAGFKALSHRLSTTAGDSPKADAVKPIDPELKAKIDSLLDEIEKGRASVSAEMSQQEATQNLMRAANAIRNRALKDRRDGADMMRFHRDFAKLATVMDLALSLNEIAAAQAAIKDMLALLETKRAAILASQQSNQTSIGSSAADLAQVPQYTADANKTLTADQSSQKDMASQEAQAAQAAARISGFQEQITALIAQINAADKARSPDALTEYARRNALLPQVVAWRTNGGNPNDPNAFSLKTFTDDLKQADDLIIKAQDGLNRIPTVPIEYAGLLIVAVPGPEVHVTNPTRAQIIQLLKDRRVYWSDQGKTYQGNLDTVNRMMDPANSNTVVDEFGDSHPESLPRWLSQSQTDFSQSQAAMNGYFAQLDAIAVKLNSSYGAGIPMLAGRSLTDLQTVVKTYGDKLKAVKFPANDDTDASRQAKLDLILAAQLAPYGIREVIRSSYDQAVIDQINKAMATTLPAAKTGLQGIMTLLADIASDIDADEAVLNTIDAKGNFKNPADRQGLIDRKTALLRDRVLPGLRGARAMLADNLIPYQQDAIKSAASTQDGDYFKLYDGKQQLLTQTQDLYKKTMPWELASFGGSPDDVPGSLASIDAWNASLKKYIDGYDDAAGHHQGIAEYQKDMADRQCTTGCTRRESLYGQDQPYSLPMKISQYTQERLDRAGQINAQAATVNEILGKIKQTSGGKYDLTAYYLPLGVGADPASVARVQKVVDDKVIQNLGDALKKIADETQAASGGSGVTINAGGSGTVPTGTQPSPTVSANQQIALLALDAGKRLVPNSLSEPGKVPVATAVARYLYSDAVVNAANDALTNQVPQAVAFLDRASSALGAAMAQSTKDKAYVNSGGASESADSVLSRKVEMFRSLDALLKDASAFYGTKLGWDQTAFGTIDKVNTYYSSVNSIYTNAVSVNNNEITALNTIEKTLQDMNSGLETTRVKVLSWMSQLNPREQSAMSKPPEDVSQIMEKTREVLKANIPYLDLKSQLDGSQSVISAGISTVAEKQQELQALLAERQDDLQDRLPAQTVRRIDDLSLSRGSFAVGKSADATQALVVKKSEYASFVDALLGVLLQGSQDISHKDVTALKAELLKNPTRLSSYIPGSAVVDSGDNPDGFYLIYESNFSTPHLLETQSRATLGNVAQLWGHNISVTGYAFNSPPSVGPGNPPFSDRGLEVTVESIQGRQWVNYLNVDLHRFGFDIPPDNSVKANAGESRLLIFDDFAAMLLGDRLYIAAAGYGDFALSQPGERVSYVGGNLKTSIKLAEAMRLDADQRVLFAKDPRKFLEDVNLDFTGYDPSLNKTYTIEAAGENKSYRRTQIGPSIDVNRLLHPDGGGDTFTLDLFYAKTSGTDEINQTSVGATLLNGFSIKNDSGKPWLRLDNRLTSEKGARMGKLTDRLTAMMPDKGLTVNLDAQRIGGASTHYLSATKKTGDNSDVSVGYGAQSIGEANRFRVALRDSFSLGQLWRSVSNGAAAALQGGEPLKEFNGRFGETFSEDEAKRSRTVAELKKVYEADTARRLITQDIGVLSRDITDLRKAGLFLDNTRVTGSVGFTSRAVSNFEADRAIGGGFTTGAYTQVSLTRTQKNLIERKAASLYREGVRLRDRLVQTTKDWQEAVVAVAQAQWDVRLARELAARAPSDLLAAEAQVALTDAQAALHEATLRYNSLTGRDAAAQPPFEDLDPRGLSDLIAEIGRMISAPDRLATVLRGLDRDELKKQVGEDPFNLVDWIPGVESLAAGFGVQYQDMMATQALTLGVSVRIPIHDPSSSAANDAHYLESEALNHEVAGAMQVRRLAVSVERARARAAQAGAEAVAPREQAAAAALDEARRKYENGLIGADEFRAARDAWRWYSGKAFETRSAAALAQAQADIDAPFASEAPTGSAARVESLADAFEQARSRSSGLSEVAARLQAAQKMAQAQNSRIQKFWLDFGVGAGLTSSGEGFIPDLQITGVPITPMLGFELKPEEMRELQVRQHEGQREYYQALAARLEAGLAVQIYQAAAAYRAADERAALYDEKVLPAFSQDARRADAARLERAQAQRVKDESKAILNTLLGRPAEADLAMNFDAAADLKALRELLAPRSIVESERTIRQSRVKVARAVEEMIDKDLKVDVIRLEPVSLIVRAFGRLLGALKDGPVFNPENAAAARTETVMAERDLKFYEQRRAVAAARLRHELGAQIDALDALKDKSDPTSQARRNAGEAKANQLRAGLLALGESPDEARDAKDQVAPTDRAELKRRLAESYRAQNADAGVSAPEIPAAEVRTQRSSSSIRYFIGRESIGHDPIDRNYVEGWVELRLRDPNTPADVRLTLAKLQQDRAERLDKMERVAASARAEVTVARFESDTRLWRWAKGQGASAAPFEKEMRARLDFQRETMAGLLGLGDAATTDALCALVPEDAAGVANLSQSAERLIGDIRARQVETVRATLFDGGLPEGFGGPDALIEQIKANTIAERMSYKGFTPVLAAGLFRGTGVFAGFLEAPDPRNIEKTLRNLISDDLRKQFESDGRLREVALGLNRLFARVLDGAKRLEAQRRAVTGAEDDLRARIVGGDAAQIAASTERLMAAWTRLNETMLDTKSAFITLTTELEATGQSGAGTLRPFTPALVKPPSANVKDTRAVLLDFWTERMADAGFSARQDAALAGIGADATSAARARILEAGESYRRALAERDRLGTDLTPAERMKRLSEIDVAGRRRDVRDAVSAALTDVRALDAGAALGGAKALDEFVGREAQAAADAGAVERTSARAAEKQMRRTVWGSARVPPESRTAFSRLETLDADMDAARQSLIESYLADAKGDPTAFIARDLRLDEYLKAQTAFDAEMVRALESPVFANDPKLAAILQGLYPVGESLSRALAQAQYGRGVAAIDALIMVEKLRLKAGRAAGLAPDELDRIAASQGRLTEMRGRWTSGKTELEPLYAVVREDDPGRVNAWWTMTDMQSALKAGRQNPAGENSAVETGDGVVVANLAGHPGSRYKVIGGVDAAAALRDDAGKKWRDSDDLAALDTALRSPGAAFVKIASRKTAEAPASHEALEFKSVFGPEGLARTGRVFFFESGGEGRALHPVLALSRPPEQVVMMAYDGDQALRRDRFPTLRSLRESDAADRFGRLVVTPQGAAELKAQAENSRRAQWSRGWIEVALNGYGFARDAAGVAKLYGDQEEFDAELKALDDAPRLLTEALKAATAAEAERARLKELNDRAKASLDQAGARRRDYAASPSAQSGQDKVKAAADKFLFDPGADGVEARSYADALRVYLDAPDGAAAAKALDAATKELQKISEPYRVAQAKAVVAAKAAAEAQARVDHAKTWTWHRTADLTLGLDADRRVVSASAPAARGGAALAESLAPPSSLMKGSLAAAIVDEDGRLIQAMNTPEQVEAASVNWKRVSDTAAGRLFEDMEGDAAVKARFDHYEAPVGASGSERFTPVMLSRKYLDDRFAASQSRLGTANHWAIMPYNWLNIVMTVPRDVLQTPIELFTGRDPGSIGYVGRVSMFKTEGGRTDHHDLPRRVLGWFDPGILPDPVTRWFDPSQFPDAVKIEGRFSPGRILADLSARVDGPDGQQFDINFGRMWLTREVRQAAEDLAVASTSALMSFYGGLKETTLSTVRGRAGVYLESNVTARVGSVQVGGKSVPLVESRLAADPSLGGTTKAETGSLFVEGVEQRVDIVPGAAGYARQSSAMDGYGERVRQAAAQREAARPALSAAVQAEGRRVEQRRQARDEAARRENALWTW